MHRKGLEPVPKDAAELETQQDLSTENEHPGFVEGGLDEFGELHRTGHYRCAGEFLCC
jgi:hypothetical protein